MSLKQKLLKCLSIAFLVIGTSVYAQAEEEKDNTGTNPINFTNDLRVYYDFSKSDDNVNVKSGTATVEYRTPFADGKWQFRIKMPYVWKEGDSTGNGVDNIDDNGIGNVNIRFLNVPILKMEKKFALAVGLEVFFDTANDPKIGGSSILLGPQVFAVFFKPLGGGDLIAPAYQHIISVGGKDANRTQLDVFYLYSSALKGTKIGEYINWAMVNPQAVIDYENDNDTHINVDFEVGKMISSSQSLYFRPGVGVGGDRLFDWSTEIGWKMIW